MRKTADGKFRVELMVLALVQGASSSRKVAGIKAIWPRISGSGPQLHDTSAAGCTPFRITRVKFPMGGNLQPAVQPGIRGLAIRGLQ